MKKIETDLDAKRAIEFVIQTIISDEGDLGLPRFIEELKSEEDCHNLGIFPIVYVWNEDKEKGSFTVSVNGKAIAHLLEPLVSRDGPQFNQIRDQIMEILKDTAVNTTMTMVRKLGAYPSDIYPSYHYQKN